jgi:hypothetical protein
VPVDDLPVAVFAPEGGRHSQVERRDLLVVADLGLPMLDLKDRREVVSRVAGKLIKSR